MKKTKLTMMMIVILACSILFTGCASFNRGLKTFSSDLTGGLYREIIVYDAVGNELYRDSGKMDIEYDSERLLYDKDGKRHVIYYKTGTVIVNEIDK